METITFQTNVKAIDFPIIEEILKKFKATDIRIIKEEKKDDTEMAEKEFFAKIDRSMKSKRTKVTIEELRAKYL
ncbi:MAG: hypothetical protein E6494_06545 [Capnocytophaga sp.]|nr:MULTISPECIES: hypothetical protein [Capnocytophaga]EKY13708.1 hypothetical protein HMPREF9072_01382 [Capnocytophaga sp. oral taxon 324 str. F0483]MDU6659752.1 hypothetical protein [Capnocytophaga sp.]UZD41159.1 hypothetical protein OL231_01070 [Capnocytophaga ochracea]